MRRNLRTPPTAAIVAARRFAARIRAVLAVAGLILLATAPSLAPDPLAAAIGFGVIAITALVQRVVLSDRWLRVEEALSCTAGFLIVTLGGGEVTSLTLLWIACVAVGVLARGGRAGTAGRVLILSILASPLVLHGVDAATVGLLVAGIGLLLAAGRISLETSELLSDPLTGALTRAAFDAQVDRRSAGAAAEREVAVIMLDLDDFGSVNKLQGHRAGDELLAAAAKAMRASIRDEDILGRVGGDEFAVLTNSESPESVASRTLDAIAETGSHASAGVARCPADGRNADTLLAAADVALRLSKQGGKHRVTNYSGPEMTMLVPDCAEEALVRLCRGDGVSILLQPIVDLSRGSVHSYEAIPKLEVWERNEGAAYWFALADGFGMRRDLERTCARAALALLPGLPEGAGLAVNLASEMLEDEEVLAAFEARAGSGLLIVEVPEENLVRSDPALERAMTRLRETGVQFAIDGVGGGRAGLGQLAVVRPVYLKLDSGLVREIDRNPDRAAFMRALATHATDSGFRVIADGVETMSEVDVVRAAGVSLAQGSLLGRPRPNPETGAHRASSRIRLPQAS